MGEVRKFYKGTNVFITGATGFVGLALIEKLLHTFPDIGSIYLLMRPKRGVDVQTRLEELKKNSVFAKLKEDEGEEVLNKLVAVSGDVGDEHLGLVESERKVLLESVNVIFHCAASLDFETNLITAVNVNLLGTRRVIELGKQCKNLKSMVHVSSAYVNANRKEAGEKLYELPSSAEHVIEVINSLDSTTVDEIAPDLLKDHPNTYTFTKALAEHEVAKSYNPLVPTVIVRPSMILGAWKDPIPGWTASKNGPQGFLMGASKGVVRRLPADVDLVYDYVPVDIVVNYMIVTACYAALKQPEDVPVYHITTSTCNPFRWRTVKDKVSTFLNEYPLKGALWYPTLKILPSLVLFKISAVFFHILPALALDTLSILTGGRPILLKLHRNIYRSLDRLSPFIFRQWFFRNPKALSLQEFVQDEKDVFCLDVRTLDWEEYFRSLAIGVRTYLHKEPMSNLQSARRKHKILNVLNILLQILVVSLIWHGTAHIFGTSLFLSSWILLLILMIHWFL